MRNHKTRELLSLYWLSAVLNIGFSAILALTAEIRNAFKFSSTEIGLIGAAAFAAAFLSQILLSKLADQGHGQRMIRIGIILSILSSIWMVFATTIEGWIISRAALGFGSGMIMPAIRRFVIINHHPETGRALGVLTAYETGGFLLGPVLATILNWAFGFNSSFLMLAVLMTIFVPMIWRIEILGSRNIPKTGVMSDLLKKPEMQSAIAMGICFWITVGIFEGIWSIFLDDLGASQAFIGLTLTVFGIPIIFIAPIAGELAEKKGPLLVGTNGIVAAMICMIIYGCLTDLFLKNLWLICVPLAIHSIADAYTMPSTRVAIAKASGEDAAATGQGLFGAIGSAVAAATAGMSGIIYQIWGALGLMSLGVTIMAGLMLFAWYKRQD